jgi:predicted HTH transcriptional regulator
MVEYFTDGVASSIKTVKERVIGLSKDIKVLKEKGKVTLNKRQMLIVEKIIADGKITNKDIKELFGLSDTSAKNEISKLIDLEVIERKGKGRSTHYVLI